MEASTNNPGKVVIWHKVTGERLERWPVDAREILSFGEHTTTDPGITFQPKKAKKTPAAKAPVPQDEDVEEDDAPADDEDADEDVGDDDPPAEVPKPKKSKTSKKPKKTARA